MLITGMCVAIKLFDKGHGVLGQESEAFSKVNYTVNDAINTESSGGGSSGGGGGGESTPSEPAGVIDTIYWGIDAYGKLTISDVQVVPSLEGESGSFDGDKIFGQYETPWYPYADSIYSIEVIGHNRKIAPASTTRLFQYLKNVSYVDVTDLDTSNVTNMSYMFGGCGIVASSFTIVGLDTWNTSNVTDMRYMFFNAGRASKTWNIGDLSGWDTSKVIDMGAMFYYAGRSTSTISLDFTDWSTDGLEYATYMFCGTGSSATSKNIVGLERFERWDIFACYAT